MDRDSVERLRFDRRLQQRPDWLESADREAYLAALPDVSEKMTTCAEEEYAAEATSAEESVAEAAPPTTTPSPQSTSTTPSTTPPATPPATPLTTPLTTPSTEPVPIAGDFSTPRPFGDRGGDRSEN